MTETERRHYLPDPWTKVCESCGQKHTLAEVRTLNAERVRRMMREYLARG